MGTLFVGPYIMRLFKCIRILQGKERVMVVGSVASMTLETLRLM